MKSKIQIIFCALLFVVATLFAVHAQDSEEISPAKQKVRDFEGQLYKKVMAAGRDDQKLINSKEFQNEIRHFFSELNSTEMRLEAMWLLGSRFLPIVTRETAADLIEPLIQDSDPIVQWRAVEAIADNGCGGRYAKKLISLLEGDVSPGELNSVAQAMGRSKHEPFVPYLEKMLNHSSEGVRSIALDELTRLAPTLALNHNVRLLDDIAPSVRSAAIENIARANEQIIIPSLEKMLKDKDPSVREQAVLELGELNISRSGSVISVLLQDKDNGVRAQSAIALGKLQQNAWEVSRLLKDQDVVARRNATKAMGMMGDPSFIDQLRPLLNDDDDQVRKLAAESIAKLESGKPVRK